MPSKFRFIFADSESVTVPADHVKTAVVLAFAKRLKAGMGIAVVSAFSSTDGKKFEAIAEKAVNFPLILSIN